MARSAQRRDEAPLVDLDGFTPYLLNRVSARANQNLSALLRERKLTFQHWRILLVLVNRGRRTVNTLADDAGVPQSTLSRLLVRMEKAGLVHRLPHPGDSRVVEAEATEQGARALADILPLADRVWEPFTRPLSPAERTLLRQLLQRMLLAAG
jgi:DNA-binding MarR family transcriptional regulator